MVLMNNSIARNGSFRLGKINILVKFVSWQKMTNEK